MSKPLPVAMPPSCPPVTSIEEAVATMQRIAADLPAHDGLACFNRMYLEVTRQVQARITDDFFTDNAFMARLDVVFANIYFAAVDAVARSTPLPVAWRPLITLRTDHRIEPIQFALAGMNIHINHDLPLAVVATCTELASAPSAGPHHADYQRVDLLLDAAVQSVRQSFESGAVLDFDRHTERVANLIGIWSIDAARDMSWDTACALWEAREHPVVLDLLVDVLVRTVSLATRGLLVVV
jgi:hypothetical protein